MIIFPFDLETLRAGEYSRSTFEVPTGRYVGSTPRRDAEREYWGKAKRGDPRRAASVRDRAC